MNNVRIKAKESLSEMAEMIDNHLNYVRCMKLIKNIYDWDTNDVSELKQNLDEYYEISSTCDFNSSLNFSVIPTVKIPDYIPKTDNPIILFRDVNNKYLINRDYSTNFEIISEDDLIHLLNEKVEEKLS